MIYLTKETFNLEFKKHLYQDLFFEIIEPFDIGWLDGGCFMLMSALSQWLGKPAVAMYSYRAGSQAPDHGFVMIGGQYFDANGIQTRKEFYDYWKSEEGIVIAGSSFFDRSNAIEQNSEDMIFEEDCVKKIVEQLDRKYSLNNIRCLCGVEQRRPSNG